MTNRSIVCIAIIVLSLFLLQCGSSEQSQQDVPPSQQTQGPVDPPLLRFETSMDTVDTRSTGETAAIADRRGDVQIRYMVQIGAFRDAQNASRVQATARERYHMPVINDFHTALSLYQVRIGFFETMEAAQVFRSRLQREHPADYRDSWVVQLKQ
jgi:cell division protein FtsN